MSSRDLALVLAGAVAGVLVLRYFQTRGSGCGCGCSG